MLTLPAATPERSRLPALTATITAVHHHRDSHAHHYDHAHQRRPSPIDKKNPLSKKAEYFNFISQAGQLWMIFKKTDVISDRHQLFIAIANPSSIVCKRNHHPGHWTVLFATNQTIKMLRIIFLLNCPLCKRPAF